MSTSSRPVWKFILCLTNTLLESVAALEDCYLAGVFVSGQNKSD